MFHTCVQRFDGIDEKFLDGELNRALDGSVRLGLHAYHGLRCAKDPSARPEMAGGRGTWERLG